MRVITGTARGRRLKEPRDADFRPTLDRIKETMFDIVQFDIEGRRVLDLFAGSGQLGIEALSRGAASCVFVDSSTGQCNLIRENLRTTKLADNTTVVRSDAEAYLKRGERFDIVFLDPPFDAGLLEKMIEKLREFDILKENGIIVCESFADTELSALAGPEFTCQEYRHGRVKITVFKGISTV